MPNLYPQDPLAYIDIFAILLRLLGVFLLAPGFNHRSIPMNIKVVFAFALALAIYPVVRPYLSPIPESLGGIFSLALRETAIGFMLGIGAHLVVEGIHTAAQFIGFQMGFGVGGLMDPQMQSSVTIMVPFYGWIVLTLFFLLNIHHELLSLFVASFKLTRGIETKFLENENLMKLMVELFGELFVIAVKMAAPFTLLCLASQAAVGVLNRLMPQMNVLLISFPITILLGFVTFYLVAPEMINFIENVLGNVSERTLIILRSL